MRIDLTIHIVAGAVGILSGFVALFTAKGGRAHRRVGIAFVYAMITMALVGAGMAVIRGKAPEGNGPIGVLTTYLVSRHVWRMTLALAIASFSFFLGQAKVIPKPVRIYPVLAIPPLIVLVAMAYWVWRIRIRRRQTSVVVPAAWSRMSPRTSPSVAYTSKSLT